MPEGTLVIRAAEQIGIQIPRFCDHPLLDPVGACRQCLVDVPDAGNGRPMPKPQASCTLPVAAGMVVRTQNTSPVADKAQQGNMEFLLINHPLDCPVCDKGGECPLQNQAMSNGRGESRFTETKRTFPKPINISAQVLLDRERCVLCARCTRFSEQIAGDPFISMLERGSLQQVGIYEKEPFESYFSGNTDPDLPGRGAHLGCLPVPRPPVRPGLDAVGLRALRVRLRAADRPPPRQGDSPAGARRPCGQRGVELRQGPVRLPVDPTLEDRLTTPMVRDEETGELRAGVMARGVRRRGARAGAPPARSVGVLPGGRLTAEDAYAYGKFARAVLGTNDVDFRARPLSDEEADFLAAHVATQPGANYADLEHANAVLLVGFEPEEESPIVFLRLRKAVREPRHSGLLGRLAHLATASRKLGGRAAAGASRRGGGGDRRRSPPTPEVGLDSRRRDPGRRADGHVAGSAQRGRRRSPTPPVLGWRGFRVGPESAARSRSECCRRCCPAGGRCPTPLPASTSRRRGASTSLPSIAGRNTDQIVAAAAAGELRALVVGGVEVDDLARPGGAPVDALDTVGFLVSLEVRAVCDDRASRRRSPGRADRRARRAPSSTGRAGSGRSSQVLDSRALSDVRVLAGIADELGPSARLPARVEARAEHDRARAVGRRSGPSLTPVAAPLSPPTADRPASARLSTWRMLIDDARAIDGEPYLLATGRRRSRCCRRLHSSGSAWPRATWCYRLHRRRLGRPCPRASATSPTTWCGCRRNSDGVNLRRDLRRRRRCRGRASRGRQRR